MAVDWLKIKTEYINGLGSYRELAEKHGVSIDAIKKRAAAEKWKEKRTEYAPTLLQKVQDKTAERIAEKEADRVSRLLCLSDQLAERIAQAIQELDQSQVTHKTKTRVLEYKDSNALGKPTKETIQEEEKVFAVASIVDRKGLQQVAAALKTVWDISGAVPENNHDIEDDGLIAALGDNASGLFDGDDDSAMLPEEGGK